MKRYVNKLASFLAIVSLASIAGGQVIDFETLPDGTSTMDRQIIFDQYEAAFGVTFALLDHTTGLPVGNPQIAKVGSPITAFQGCDGDDAPLLGQGVGGSFLTDDGIIESGSDAVFDLLIRYTTPVSQVSGVLIDVDCRGDGGPPCEQWTITARGSDEQPLQVVVVDAPTGEPNPECAAPGVGPGDSLAIGWSLDVGVDAISSVLIQYTGDVLGIGIAFDNFSPAVLAPPPSVSVTSTPWNKICPGENVDLLANVVGGSAPFTYQWQQETSPGTWINLGTVSTQTVAPCTTIRYRVIVTDAEQRPATPSSFLPACVGLMRTSMEMVMWT